MLQELTEWKSLYKPGKATSWHGRSDGTAPERFHEVIEITDLTQEDPIKPDEKICAFLGFASDEGIRRNKGRPGAKEGPKAIREALSNLPIPYPKKSSFYDVGDIVCEDGELETAQKGLGQVVAYLLSKKTLPIIFGGGHETAWGHFQGITAAYPKADCAIINFDAHFDLRPQQNDTKGSSGTPFTQIAASRLSEGLNFSYTCFGIQQTGNTHSLFEKAKELNVHTVTADTFHLGDTIGCLDILDEIILQHRMLYVTICLDVLAAAYAPGVSAPQALGLTPWHIIPLLHHLAASGKVVGIDITELSPPLDYDGQTAKVAASLVSEFIHHLA